MRMKMNMYYEIARNSYLNNSTDPIDYIPCGL